MSVVVALIRIRGRSRYLIVRLKEVGDHLVENFVECDVEFELVESLAPRTISSATHTWYKCAFIIIRDGDDDGMRHDSYTCFCGAPMLLACRGFTWFTTTLPREKIPVCKHRTLFQNLFGDRALTQAQTALALSQLAATDRPTILVSRYDGTTN